MSNFITDIKIKKVRHLENIDIKLGSAKKHLILTGKNGCGKSSVLDELDKIFNDIYTPRKGLFELEEKPQNIVLQFTQDIFNIENKNFIYAFFKAKRTLTPDKFTHIEKIVFPKDKVSKLNNLLVKYLISLKVERSFAKDDNEIEIVNKIDSWFSKFENILQQIFNDSDLILKFDRKKRGSYNFKIEREGREEFDFYTLSDGYSAILDIVSELILKIENTEAKNFDCEGIVLIDEVETHLHVELQKNILPFLTTFFPNIQFIIATHSPFVLQSIENSIVYDLERKEQLSGEKLVSASYTDIVKNYFEIDSEFSKALKNEFQQYIGD